MIRLKDVAVLVAGKSPAAHDIVALAGGLPFVQGNAEFGPRHPSPRRQCDDAPRRCEPGDILVSLRAPVGALNLAAEAMGIGRGVCAVRATGAEPGFLWWWLHHARAELSSSSTGSTFPAITMSALGGLRIPSMPRGRQRAIAGRLDRETAGIDTLTARLERLIAALGEQRAATIAHAVSHVRAPASPVPLRRLLRRNEPGAWGQDRPDGDGTIVLRSTDQTAEGRWSIVSPARRALSRSEAASTRLVEGDLLVTRSSGSPRHVGKTTLVDREVAALGASYGTFLQRLRLREPCSPRFYWHVLNSPTVRDELAALATTTTGLANLSGAMIGAVRVPCPTRAEQDRVVHELDAALAGIDALATRIERLLRLVRERRSALISAAVTGATDAQDDARPAESR